MKVKFTQPETNSKIRNNRKEKHFYKQYTTINKDLNAIIQLRLYATPAAHYCCVWVNDRKHNVHISGGARTTGYGFHRASDAAEKALNVAGIYTSEPISGRGDEVIRNALGAIMNALGYRKHTIMEAHA
jgi:hypothetical protein